MDFELKTLALAEAARQKCDALVVVVPEAFRGDRRSAPGGLHSDAARKAGDFEGKAGKLLHAITDCP